VKLVGGTLFELKRGKEKKRKKRVSFAGSLVQVSVLSAKKLSEIF
jgi:hypothetical protein